jgi:hypothetical protein
MIPFICNIQNWKTQRQKMLINVYYGFGAWGEMTSRRYIVFFFFQDDKSVLKLTVLMVVQLYTLKLICFYTLNELYM